ncbi:MAG TPA: hypothetical protein VKV74_15925 [Bryobacteraceae bacterium]|nr:hypothetical protein [Bryobacteraceae bacterium]
MEPGFARQAASIVLVFALLAALWLIRRRGVFAMSDRNPLRRTRSIYAVERLVLTPHHTLHLLRVEFQGEGRELLVATHPQGCTTLLNPVNFSELATQGALKGVGA